MRLLKFYEATSRDILAPLGAVPFLIAIFKLSTKGSLISRAMDIVHWR